MTVKETAEYDNFLGKKEELAKPAALFDIEETEESEREKLWVGMPEFEQNNAPLTVGGGPLSYAPASVAK